MKKSLHYCFFIQLVFIILFILFDERFFVMAYTQSVGRAISIAISYMLFDLQGYVGLKDIYTMLDNEPFIRN